MSKPPESTVAHTQEPSIQQSATSTVLELFAVIRERKLIAPLVSMALVSVFGAALIAKRTLWTGRWNSLYLPWNLFLAWLPLWFALQACCLERLGRLRNWNFVLCGTAWLAFFPNAPYIFTDLVHLTTRHRVTFWTDLVLILLFAITGLLLGFLSLYLMQSLVARRCGRIVGWLFVAVSASLGSAGIYIGRFLRWNSWDIVANPLDLLRDILGRAASVLAHRHEAVFPLLLTAFLFLAYVMFYTLTHLEPMKPSHGNAVLLENSI